MLSQTRIWDKSNTSKHIENFKGYVKHKSWGCCERSFLQSTGFFLFLLLQYLWFLRAHALSLSPVYRCVLFCFFLFSFMIFQMKKKNVAKNISSAFYCFILIIQYFIMLNGFDGSFAIWQMGKLNLLCALILMRKRERESKSNSESTLNESNLHGNKLWYDCDMKRVYSQTWKPTILRSFYVFFFSTVYVYYRHCFFFLLLYILLSFVLLFNKHVDISKCLLDMMSKISNPNRSIHAKQYFVKLLHFYLNRPTTTKKNERTNERNKCVVFCADESGCHPSNSFCP